MRMSLNTLHELEFVLLIEERKGKCSSASSASMFLANLNGGYALDHQKKKSNKKK